MGTEANIWISNRNKGFYDIEMIKKGNANTNRLNIIWLDKSEY